MSAAPTGEQYEINSGNHRAVVTEVGATLRRFSVDGRDVVHGFDVTETIKGGRGQNLIPWPNRIRDGRYTFNGITQQLALTEPARHNASHGLARYVPWVLVEQQADTVVNRVRIHPQPGWSGTLDATITHRVSADGLTVTVEATNLSDEELPFGYGAHPYLTVGESSVDEVALTVPAASYLEVDDRLLPARLSAVDGTVYDLRRSTVLGSANLDTAMTDLTRDSDGRWRIRLTLGDRYAELWGDETFAWTQVFTGGPNRDAGVAVEPMTCGPNAFNAGPTHDDLRVLAPQETFVGQWGITGR
ncbi:MAG TPA: aldose 1-epimerase family protein [Propionibacteriaceae bacterium]|nr:aldose 1-epimerase family protein [Propionibacteriaceae bacterium]